MSETIHVILKFCSNLQSDISEPVLKQIYQYICSPESGLVIHQSIDAFLDSYKSKSYEDVQQIDVLNLSSALKLRLYKILFEESSKNDSKIQKDEVYTLPELPSLPEDIANQLRSAKLQETKKQLDSLSISKKTPALPTTARFLKNLLGVKKSFDIAGKPSAVDNSSLEHAESMELAAHEFNDRLGEIQEQEFSGFKAGVQYVDHDMLTKSLQTKMQQLQDVRSQLYEERKKLHQTRLIIANEISSITDPKISALLKELNDRKNQLDYQEKMLIEQKSVMEKGILHAQQKLAFLQEDERKLRSVLIQLDQEKHVCEQQLAQLQTKALEGENNLELANKRLLQITKQIQDAQSIYEQMTSQATRVSDEIKASREELLSWEKELEDKEHQLGARERHISSQLQKEREALHHRAKEQDAEYKRRLKIIQAREVSLENQKNEFVALKEDLLEVKKVLQHERAELDAREKDLNRRFLAVEARERDLNARERSLNESTQKSLEYVDEKKRDLEKQLLLKEAEFERRLVDIQAKELELIRKEESLTQNMASVSTANQHKPITFKKHERQLHEAAQFLDTKLHSLHTLERAVAHDTSAPAAMKNIVHDIREVPTPQLNGGPLLIKSSEPRSESTPVKDLLLPDDPQENNTSLREVEALIELAKEELAKDVRVARITYNQIRKVYHGMSVDQKKILFPKLMTLYDEIQNRGASAL